MKLRLSDKWYFATAAESAQILAMCAAEHHAMRRAIASEADDATAGIAVAREALNAAQLRAAREILRDQT